MKVKYKIGMEVDGKVTGIQPYGVFVELDKNHQGLIHISEVEHGYIKKVDDIVKMGDAIRVKIIDIDEHTQKISLSLRVYDSSVRKNTKRKKRYFTNKNQKIGFETLAAALPFWIEEALGSLPPISNSNKVE